MRDFEPKNSLLYKPTNLEKKRVIYISGIICKTVLLICISVGLTACSPSVYHVNLKYEPSGKFLKGKSGLDFPITVALFNDMRQTRDKLQLGTVTNISGDTIPILPKNGKVPDAVAKNVREYLSKSGYRLSDNVPIWDLRKETINKDWGKILVGGNVDELEIVCDNSFPVKTYRAKVKLTLVFANVPAKRIFDQISVKSSSSLKDISFSDEMLEEQINAAFSDALEKIFSDDRIRMKIDDESRIKS